MGYMGHGAFHFLFYVSSLYPFIGGKQDEKQPEEILANTYFIDNIYFYLLIKQNNGIWWGLYTLNRFI